MNARAISVSVITSDRRLSKGFTLSPAGELVKEQGGAMVSGRVERRDVALNNIPALIQSLTAVQALVLGEPRGCGEAIITTKALAETGKAPAGAITRSNADFCWSTGPGLLLLDYDPPKGCEPLTRAAVWAEMVKCVPELENVPVIQSDSASSHIYGEKGCLKGSGGLHFFIPVQHADEIPLIGDAIARRLRYAGHVYDVRSKSGALLKRTLIDTSVWQSSRLSFDAGAACGAGLEQRRPAPETINPDGAFLSLDMMGITPDDPDPTEPTSPDGPGRRAIRGADGSVARFVKNMQPVAVANLEEDTVALLRDALTVIPSEGYESWIAVGLALSSCAQGYEIWKEWSLVADNADSESSLRRRWKSLKTDGRLDWKSVLRIAMKAGWGWDKTEALTRAGVTPHRLREQTATYTKPWRTTQHEQAVAALTAVPVEQAREEMKSGLQKMVGEYLGWYGAAKDDRGPSSPWLFSPTMGVGKSTSIMSLTRHVDLRMSGGRVVVSVPDHAQALEYERGGWWHFWGRQSKIDETCGSATQKDALCQNHSSMMQAVEAGHIPQAEFCRTCSHGLAWSIREAERQTDEDDISDDRAKKLQERIAGHRATLRGRGLDPDRVDPCKWQGHLRMALDKQFVVIVAQSYSHSLVRDALYISDERFEAGKPVAVTLQDVDHWAKRNAATIAKMEGMESMDSEWLEHLEVLRKAQLFFQRLARDLAKWIGRTGAVSIDPDLLNAVAGLLDLAKAKSNGRGVALAGWETLRFAADGSLDDAPLRAAFAIAETLEGGDGHVADGSLHVSASTPVMERIAVGLPVCVMDATPDPVIVSSVHAHGGQVVHAIARQAVRITRHPTRFWGLKALNVKKVGLVRVEKELDRYRAAILYHQDALGADGVAFLMHKRAFDLLFPDPATAPDNCGYWGRDHRAHNRWSGKHLVVFGSFFPPMDAWRSEYQASRIGALAAGCDPDDWPIWGDGMEMSKKAWLQEGAHDVPSSLPMPDDAHIRQWLLARITSEAVQAIGRCRGANLTEPVTVTIYGGVPLAGLGAYGLEVSEYLSDHESFGVVKAEADAESQQAGMAALDAAAMQAIVEGKTITRQNLDVVIQEQKGDKNSLFHQGSKSPSLVEQTPHPRIYAAWFAMRAPELARHMVANGRNATLVKNAREYARLQGVDALAQAVSLAEASWIGCNHDAQRAETSARDAFESSLSSDEEAIAAEIVLDALDALVRGYG